MIVWFALHVALILVVSQCEIWSAVTEPSVIRGSVAGLSLSCLNVVLLKLPVYVTADQGWLTAGVPPHASGLTTFT